MRDNFFINIIYKPKLFVRTNTFTFALVLFI